MIEAFPILPGRSLKFGAAQERDARSLRSWQRTVRQNSNPVGEDAYELAVLAFRRWREGKAKRIIANDLRSLRYFIRRNPKAEVLMLTLAKASWFSHGRLVGLALFRRTWYHSLYVHYVVIHPRLAGNPKSPLRLVGTVLLYYIICVAVEINATAIWGETTQTSAQFYEKVLGRTNVKDFLYITSDEFQQLKTRIEGMFQL